MTEVEAGQIVRDVAELYEPVAEEKGVDLEAVTPEPVTLQASRELLGQALANLVDNAIKHGLPEGAERPLRIVMSTAREGDDLVLRVADNGVGIPENDRERVFQRFVRLEKSRSTAGSGLGLSLVNAVVAFHDGTIALADNDPGLVVTIRLPIVTQP
jgi:signal transduction histidine kinase